MQKRSEAIKSNRLFSTCAQSTGTGTANMYRWHVVLTAFLVCLAPCTCRLSGVVTPSNASEDGADWCQPLKPCNETKPDAVRIESGYGLGLLNKLTDQKTTFQYSNTTPASAVDWRAALTDWPVRDQGSCGKARALVPCICYWHQDSSWHAVADLAKLGFGYQICASQLLGCLVFVSTCMHCMSTYASCGLNT